MSVSDPYLEALKKELRKIKDYQGDRPKLDLSDPVAFVRKHIALPRDAPPDQKDYFEKREYLLPIYRQQNPNMLIVKGRGMEVTEFAVNMLLYYALKYPHNYFFATSTLRKVRDFSKDRLMLQITRSPDIAAYLDKENVEVHRMVLGTSRIYLYSAYDNMDTLRSYRANGIILDEFQDMKADALPVAEELLSHSPLKKMLVIGTPKEAGGRFEEYWNNSTKEEWNTEKQIWESTSSKQEPFFTGYHISQNLAIGKWLTEKDIQSKKERYPKQKFANEVLGEFYTGLGRPLTMEKMMDLFDPYLEKAGFKTGETLVAGVDWGVGKKANTVFCLTRPRLYQYPNIFGYDVLYMERIDYEDLMQHLERVKSLCGEFNVARVGLDIGAGAIQNQEIYKALGTRMFQVQYIGARPEKPMEIDYTSFGPLMKVDRTFALDTAFDLITRPGRVRFYNEKDLGTKDWIVGDFMSEYPEVNERSGRKEWLHDPDTTDDALMAFVYSLLAYDQIKKIGNSASVSDYLTFI
jgi:hypothetical protein